MTINIADNTPRVSYAVAQGATQTSFTVSFEFFDAADLNVYVDGTLKTLAADYTVSGGDGSTGSVSISVTGATGGSTVVITRDIALERTTDFPASGAFQINSLNTELDRLTAIAADLSDKANRSLQLTDYDTAVSLVLPDVDTRKGKTLAFNATSGAVEAGPSITDVQTVSAASADIATLADIEDGTDATDTIQTVAGIAANVSTVAGVSADVTTVAGQTTNMQNITDNLSDVQNAATNATNAAASASAASTSETNAATSESNSASSATSSANSATASASSASASAASASAASTSESNSSTSETNAASSASSASTSSATATTQAGIATTKAGEASTSASNAATSEANSATSETNAASSATAAAASQVSAAASAASAASAFDNFDDTYLGSYASDPTVDNDGDALVQGALYFNTTANEMRVYDGGSWIAASSAGGASLNLFEYTATAGQTTFSGADDNAATLSYTLANIIVTLNGITLDPSDYTATSGTSIVLASGAALNDELNIIAFKSFTTADMVSATNGGTFAGNVTVNGTLAATAVTGDGSGLTGLSSDLVDDTTPQLGGDLDLNSSDITGTGNINITGTVTATSFSGAGFPSGTLMLFQQTAAPTGWTKQTTHNDKALRVVTGSAGSGGSVAFSTAMATPSVSGSVSISGSISNTTLSTSQMPSHNHTFSRASGGGNNSSAAAQGNYSGVVQLGTSSVGGGGSHNHGHSLSGSLSSSTATINVNYVDLIIAAKD